MHGNLKMFEIIEREMQQNCLFIYLLFACLLACLFLFVCLSLEQVINK